MSRSLGLILSLALGVLPAFALGADEPSGASLEQVLIESASTPKAHLALANYYAAQAAAAREEAASHRAMGKAYSGGKGSQIAMMKEHCEKLATLEDEQAKQFDAMAAMHREMAK